MNVFKEIDLQEIKDTVIFYRNNFLEIFFRESIFIEYIHICLYDNIIHSNEISISIDNQLYDCDNMIFIKKNNVYLQLNSEIKVNKIKIFFNKNIDINFCKVFERKFPGLMIAARSDGLGARLMPILNAMFLAEYTGFKFGYVWVKSQHDVNSLKKSGANSLAGIYLSDENYIFDKTFIDKYSYTNNIPTFMKSPTCISLNNLINKPYEQKWGNYVGHLTVQSALKNVVNFGREYPRLWKSIQFSQRISEIIMLSENTCNTNFPDRFVAIHIRSGDIVYDMYRQKDYAISLAWNKAMPLEIALELIELEIKNNSSIVLFSDDFTSIEEIKKNITYDKLFIVGDFIEELNSIDRLFFELTFMSNAKYIYSGNSSLARAASYIGIGCEPIFYFLKFNYFDIYNIIKRHYNKYNFNHMQVAFTSYYMCLLCKEIGKDDLECLKFIKKAYTHDINNIIYKIGYIIYLIKASDINSALELLFEVKNWDDFWNACNNSPFRDDKLILLPLGYFLNDNLFYIFYVKYFNECYGVFKVKKHLSYKLGRAIIDNSKSIKGYVELLYILYQIKKQHYKEQLEYKKLNETIISFPKLPPISMCSDYKEALKIKNFFSYKLGQILVKAHKNWYKGGYIKFWLDLYKLRKEYKNKRGK